MSSGAEVNVKGKFLGGADEPRAAQVFERPRQSHPHHVLTLRSALVDRVA